MIFGQQQPLRTNTRGPVVTSHADSNRCATDSTCLLQQEGVIGEGMPLLINN
jgi:hypothetical protein